MGSRITKVVAAVAEFIMRLWPISRDEESILAEQQALYRRDSQTEDDDATEISE